MDECTCLQAQESWARGVKVDLVTVCPAHGEEVSGDGSAL